MDLPDNEEGRQLAYNNAARVDAGRGTDYIILHDAWSSISYLDPLELARFSEMYFVRCDCYQQPFTHGYTLYEYELTVGETDFFNRKCGAPDRGKTNIISQACKTCDIKTTMFNPVINL